MKRRIFMGLALAATLPGLALAHGPTRQKITVTTEVAAEPAEVWEAIGDFQDLTWHPAVISQTGEGGNEIDATRVLHLSDQGADGPTISEILYKYDADKMTYSYRITDVAVEVLPVTNYSSHLTVKPLDGGGSLVEWRGAFYRGYPNNDPPEELNDEAGMTALVERFGAPGS
ncbi:SRPBCC family protein [Roseivivax sediminis]|uniref:Polyketide cyclase / dehydrase and lipid transport n=1 Tax=Roseivivax sediminis TaxID=936889 RepID=A0A1I1TW53_9RHOB|nr:SRPBCC family protein [Roseivivax sediminis]SFD62759.1 Polyketide cyclase / dehydrase and lipid transport [Roseivivax sediminis]